MRAQGATGIRRPRGRPRVSITGAVPTFALDRKDRGPSSSRRRGLTYRLTAEPCELSSQRLSKRYGVGRTTVLAASVTAPIRASALPLSVAPVSRVID